MISRLSLAQSLASASIECNDLNSSTDTQFGEGNLNAVLISSSKGAVSSAAAAQSSSRKLTIIKP